MASSLTSVAPTSIVLLERGMAKIPDHAMHGMIRNLCARPNSGERQEAGGQYTKCMIPKGRDPLTSAFARSKHWVFDEWSCWAASNRR